MKKWEHDAIRDGMSQRGALADWPELREALANNGLSLPGGVSMIAVREMCRLILAERKTADAYAKAGGAASTIQAMLLEREIYASLADIAECYRCYCGEFASAGWLAVGYWDDVDHIGPVDYIAARVAK